MGETSVSDRARTFVLNALTDLVCDDPAVVVDEQSRACLDEAVSATLSDGERTELRELLSQYVDESTGEVATDIADAHQEFLVDVAERVAATLAARDVEITLCHEARISIEPRNAHLCSVLTTRNPALIDAFDLPTSVRERLVEGVRAVTDEAYDEAIAAFDAGVDAAGDSPAIVPKVLAAWARSEAGDDDGAVELVQEVLEDDPSAWPAKLVGAVADHSSPSLFREGRLATRAFVRSRLDPHEEEAIAIDVGVVADDSDGVVDHPGDVADDVAGDVADDAAGDVADDVPAAFDAAAATGDDVDWLEVTGDSRCLVVPRIAPEMRIRLRVSGTISSFPDVQMYYLAAGIVDTVEMVPRSVEHELAGGPVTAQARETLRFEPPD